MIGLKTSLGKTVEDASNETRMMYVVVCTQHQKELGFCKFIVFKFNLFFSRMTQHIVLMVG